MRNIIEEGIILLCSVVLDIQWTLLNAKWYKMFPDSTPDIDLFVMDEEMWEEEARRKRRKM